MKLDAVQTGRLEKPKRVLLYGCEGIGKSTFAAHAPAPIFLGPEDGTAQLDVARFPEPKTWSEVGEAVEVLGTTDHEYQTLALDTLDWLEPLCWTHVCEAHSKADIEAFGYGKGYVAALDQWRTLLAMLDQLRAKRGMDIVLIAHSHIRTFRNPEGDDFDRYELKLNTKAAGLCKEWCDALLYAAYETLTHTEDNRTRGISTGARLVHTERCAAFDAKNRYDLPPKLPLSWDEFAAAIGGGIASVDELLAQVKEAAKLVVNGDEKKVPGYIKRAGRDPLKLAKLLDWLNAKIQTQPSQQEKKAS
jgi:hypothetical protein